MSDTNTGGWAFPAPAGCGEDNGMTLRDYFAAKAMHHWLSLPIDDRQREKVGIEAYKIADAMLKAREAK